MKREEAEELLQPRTTGLFLVRESNNFPGDYTLCVVSDELKKEVDTLCNDYNVPLFWENVELCNKVQSIMEN